MHDLFISATTKQRILNFINQFDVTLNILGPIRGNDEIVTEEETLPSRGQSNRWYCSIRMKEEQEFLSMSVKQEDQETVMSVVGSWM